MSYSFLFHVIPLLLSTIYPLDLSIYLAARGPNKISPIYLAFRPWVSIFMQAP